MFPVGSRIRRSSFLLAAFAIGMLALRCDSEDPSLATGAEHAAYSAPSSGHPASEKGRISAPFNLNEVVRQVHFAFRGEDGKFRGGHSNYTVEVTDGAISFTPVIPSGSVLSGGGEPVSGAALRLNTASVDRGGTPLLGSRSTTLLGEKGELAVTRGPIEERLRNGDDGLEQSWAFANRPAGAGDLVVRVLAGGLSFTTASEHGLHFEDPATGLGVRYGVGQWIDAIGRRTEVRPVFKDGEIYLRVPGEVVDASAYPAILDPEVSGEVGVNTPIATGATGWQFMPTLAWSGTNYLVAWADYRSGSTYDIYATRVSSAGAILDPAGIVVSSYAYNQINPEVASDGSGFFVVWEDYRSGTSYDVYGARISSSGVNLNTVGIPIRTGANNQMSPDVAFGTGASEYLVVWHDAATTNVHGRRLSTGGVPQGSTDIDISTAANGQANPSVAYGNSKYLVVWEDNRNSATTGLDIYGTRVTNTGSVSDDAATGLIISDFGGHQDRPTATSDGSNFYVAWQDRRTDSLNDIYGTRVDATTGDRSHVNGLAIANTPASNEVYPAGAFDGDNYIIAWADKTSGSMDIHAARMYPSTGNIKDTELVVDNAASDQSLPAISGNGSATLIAWADSGSTNIRAATFDAGVAGSSFLVSEAVGRQVTPSIAYNSSDGSYLVVWQDNRNQNGWDIYGARVDGGGDLVDISGIAFAIGTGDQVEPRAASDGLNYLVVFTDKSAPTNLEINGLVLDGDEKTPTLSDNGTPFVISGGAAGNQERADVTYGNGQFFVAWQDSAASGGADIDAARVDGSFAAPSATQLALKAKSGTQAFPRVAYSGAAHEFLIVYQSGAPTLGTRIPDTGTDFSAVDPIVINGTSGTSALPVVASGSNGYLVAWAASGGDIKGALVPESGDAAPLASPIAGTADTETGPAVAWTGAFYQLAWARRQSQYDLYGIGLRADGTPIATPTLFSAESSDEAGAVLASGSTGLGLLAYYRVHPDFGTDAVWARTLTWKTQGQTGCLADDACATGYCAGGVCCGTSCGTCGTCSTGTCSLFDADTVCNPAVGVCDLPEKCDGLGSECPADLKAALGTVCRPAAGPCDRADDCDGNSVACPVDEFEPGSCSSCMGGTCDQTLSTCVAGNAICPLTFTTLGLLPVDPATVATDGAPGITTSIGDSTAFLYLAANPIQEGVDLPKMDSLRAGVIRGRIKTRHGEGLPGVKVSVLNHTEFGYTYTRADAGSAGWFDLAANGGDTLTLRFELSGYIEAQRTVTLGWQEYETLTDIVMVTAEPAADPIYLPNALPLMVHRSTVIDTDGPRRTSVFLPSNTLATSNGQLLSPVELAVTEVTVGSDGPAAMAADLPPSSAYTYAAEITASSVPGAEVIFTAPVMIYVDNFLGFRVGSEVPAGRYDRTLGHWIPSENGRVVRIVDVVAGTALVDRDGDGDGNDPEDIAALAMTPEELSALATDFSVGAELWRVPVKHFSFWDFNWVFRPDTTASDPSPNTQCGSSPCGAAAVQCKHCIEGSIIDVENQALGESFPVAGAPFSLEYRSDRMPGRAAERVFRIPLIDGNPPDGLRNVHLAIDIAGTHEVYDLAPIPGLFHDFAWSGLDPYGRPVRGQHLLRATISYGYAARYIEPDRQYAFMQAIGGAPTVAAREDFWFPRTWDLIAENWDKRGLGLGGLSISSHHVYDPRGGTIFFGDGGRLSATEMPSSTFIAAGRPYGTDGVLCSGSLTDAIDAAAVPGKVNSVALGSDGSLYFSSYCGTTAYVHRVLPGANLAWGERAMELVFERPLALGAFAGLAVSGSEKVYVVDREENRVWVVEKVGNSWPAGVPFAGNGIDGYDGLGGFATDASLSWPNDVAVGRDGVVYIADTQNDRVVVVGTDGKLRLAAGAVDAAGRPEAAADAQEACSSDPYYLSQGKLDHPRDIALTPEGELLIATTGYPCLRKVRRDGTDEIIAGTGALGDTGDNGPAAEAALGRAQGLVVDNDGTIFYLSGPDYEDRPTIDHPQFPTAMLRGIRTISPSGIIRRVAGAKDNATGFLGSLEMDGMAARHFSGVLELPFDLALSPTGDLFVGDYETRRVIRISGAFPRLPNGPLKIPSRDGSEVYEFTKGGQHLATYDALTGQPLLQFGYTPATPDGGALTSITEHRTATDAFVYNIAAGPNSSVTITAPHSLVTTLTLNAQGFVGTLANPYSELYGFDYTPGSGYSSSDGLLTTLTDPLWTQLDQTHTAYFEYDPSGLGRLVKDTNVAGGYKKLTRATDLSSRQVTVMTRVGEQEASGNKRQSVYNIVGLAGEHETAQFTQTVRDTAGLFTTTIHNLDLNDGNGRVDGRIRRTTPDDLTVTATPRSDPRFGQSSPLWTTEVTTPANSGMVVAENSTVVGADPSNPLNFTSLRRWTTVAPIDDPGAARTYDSEYTQLDNTLVETSPAARTRTTVFNTMGQPLTVTIPGTAPDPFFRKLEYIYDTEGRLWKFREHNAAPLGTWRETVVGYGSTDGYLSAVTDPESQTTTVPSYANGRPVSVVRPDAQTIGLVWNKLDSLTGVTPPGKALHEFAFNNTQELQTYTPPTVSGEVSWPTGYQYNNDQQLDLLTVPHLGSSRTIDPAYNLDTGRLETLTGTIGGQSRVVTPGYDPTTGHLASLNVTSGVGLTYGYDGPLLLSTAWSGGPLGTVARTYDNTFRVATHTVSAPSARTLAIAYDNDSLVTAVHEGNLGGAVLIELTRNPHDGRVDSTAAGPVSTGQTWTLDYRDALKMEARYNGGTPFYSEELAYSPGGKIVRKEEIIAGVLTETLYKTPSLLPGYDLAGRLEYVTRGGVTTRYYYDANGNRTDVCEGFVSKLPGVTNLCNTPTNTEYDEHDRLVRYGETTTYEYTYNGERASRTAGTTTNYSYDAFGNLTTVDPPGLDNTITYVIDGQNRRVGRKLNDVYQRGWLYDDQLRIVAELDSANAVVSRFVYLEDNHSPDLMLQGATTFRIVKDHLGSPRRVMNVATEEVVASMDFDEWGNIDQTTEVPLDHSGFSGFPFGFAGGLLDRGTGLVHFGAREYDPEVGRWLQKDPTRFAGGDTNLYAYAYGDPVNLIDPSGEVAALAIGPGLVVGFGVRLLVVAAIGAAAGAIAGELDLIGPFATPKPCDTGRRPEYDKAQPNRKKQGREAHQKKRGDGWKPFNNTKPRKPPIHHPSKKGHRKDFSDVIVDSSTEDGYGDDASAPGGNTHWHNDY